MATQETENEVLINKSYIEGTIPLINDIEPTNVVVEGENVEYTYDDEEIILGYKNSKDFIVFTTKRMYLFDRDMAGIYYKKIHIIPYKSISSGAVNFKPGKAELLLSLDSGYQVHLNFISMNHDKKENLKKIYKIMFGDR